MKRKWVAVALTSAVMISAFYFAFPFKESKQEESSSVPALSFLKNDDSKEIAYHYRKWKEVKVANGEDSSVSKEYKEKHDESLKKPKGNEEDDELTRLVYSYFHDENIYLMDDSDKFFTSSEKEEMTSSFKAWKEGELSEPDVRTKWEKLLSKSSNNMTFEQPFVVKQTIERNESAFEQLKVMEQGILKKVTTTVPAVFHVEMMYDDSKDVYTLYLIGVSQA